MLSETVLLSASMERPSRSRPPRLDWQGFFSTSVGGPAIWAVTERPTPRVRVHLFLLTVLATGAESPTAARLSSMPVPPQDETVLLSTSKGPSTSWRPSPQRVTVFFSTVVIVEPSGALVWTEMPKSGQASTL